MSNLNTFGFNSSSSGGGSTPTGNAGGDLSGTYPNPTVDGLQGRPVSNVTPVNGQVLQYDGTNWVPGSIPSGGSGGGGVVYYLNFNTSADAPLTNIPQTPNATKELGITADTISSSYLSPILSTTVYDFLASFVTDLNVPSSTVIPAGIWDFNIFVDSTTTNSANQVYFKIEILKYDGVNAPVLIASSSDTYIYDPTEITQYVTSVVVPQTTILETDRIVVYLYGRASQNNNRLTFHFGGNYPSHTHSTMPSVTGSGVVKVVNGVFQSPASTIVNADVSATANIQISKLSMATNKILGRTTAGSGSVEEIGLTVSGSSGSASLSGLSLNIPTYTLAGLGGVPTSRTITINGTTQDLSADRTFTVSSGISVGSTTSSGVDGRVFFQAGGVVQQDSGFTWDNTNKILALSKLLLSFGNSTKMFSITETSVNNSYSTEIFKRSGYNETRFNSGGIGTGTNVEQTFMTVIGSNSSALDSTSNGTVRFQKPVTINYASSASLTASAMLDVKAQGALSTDIAFRVRNSADSADIFKIQGNTNVIFGGTGADYLSIIGGTLWGTDCYFNFSGGNYIRFLGQNGDINIFTNSSLRSRGTYIGGATQLVYFDNGGNIRIGQGFNNINQPDPNATRTLQQMTGVAPTTSVADGFQQYSADITAGNAAPHFRTENGSIVKLYQNTAVTTPQGIADALTNLGVLATSTIAPAVQSVSSAATVTPTFTNDLVKITAQAVALTLAAPTGTAIDGKDLVIRIKDNGSAQTITWTSGTGGYRAIGVTLPTTTTAGKTTYVGLIYNSDDSVWDAIGVTTQA